MSIGRTTKRNSAIWNDQFTVRRAREADQAVSYIVAWKLHNPLAGSPKHMRNHESKPMSNLQAAVQRYEQRKEHAIFVELYQYDDDGISMVRRFCNLRRYRQIAEDTEWVLSVTNPPYEIVD